MADLARIKSNVAKMAAQSAPEADIDGYIASEGVTVDEVRAFQPMGAAEDTARGFATGLRDAAEGAVGGGGDAREMLKSGASWLMGEDNANALGNAVTKVFPAANILRVAPTTEQVHKATTPIVGESYQPQTTAGEYARTTGQFAPAALSPGSALKRTAQVAIPALASETAGQVTEGTEAEPYARFLGALMGGIATARNAAPKVARANADDLKAAGNRAYKASEAAGVVVNRDGMKQLARNIVDDLTEHGFDPANEPGAMAALKRVLQNQNGNVTLKGLDTIRKVASNGFVAGNKSNNAVVSKIIRRIDELIASEDPALMAGIDTPAGVRALQDARRSWGQARKLETVEGMVDRGELIGGSQINQDTAGATRRQIRTLLTSEAKGRGFTKAEKDAARKAVLGSGGQRLLHTLSGMLPQGRLSGMVHGTAAAANLATGNLPFLALQGGGMLAGYGAKKGAEALSRRNVSKFVDTIARYPKAPPPARRSVMPKRIEEIIRLLLAAEGGRVSAQTPVE